uniref:Adenylate kinase n=1 Tax=Schistosoma japonicum TaxID=6182 RepID=C1L772_SCHJA|nr:Adenylate kinase [Schistosoma japonicum]
MVTHVNWIKALNLKKRVCPCLCVINFDVSEEVMRKRLLKRAETSNRVDDNEETIVKRFRTFNELTKPVIEYYKKQNKVITIDASGTVDDIFEKLTHELQKFGIK